MNIQTARRGRYMQKTAGGTKSRRSAPSAPSKSFKEKKKAEYKQKKAEENLNTYINNNQNLKNQSTYIGSGGKDDRSVLSTVSDAPQKFSKDNESRKAFILRNTDPKTGRPNSAAQAMLNFYDDGRNDYQRGLNALRTSSPEAAQAYAKKFPVEDFAMKMGPVIAGAATGIPFGVMDYLTKTKNKAAEGINTLSERGDVFGALARTGKDIANSFSPEQAKNIGINIQSNQSIDKLLRDQNIINASTDVDPILRAAAAQTGTRDIMDIFDPEKAAIDASLPTGDIVYNPYNSNPYSPGSREYNEFEQFKQFKESQEQNEMIEGVEDGVFQRAGQFTLEPDESDVNLSGVPDYEEEFEDTFGVPMKGNITAMSLTDGSPVRGLGDRLTRETFALDNNIPLDQIGEIYPKITRYPTKDMGTYTVYDDSSLFDADQLYDGETGIPYDTVYSDKISDTPKVGQEIRGFNINNPSLMPGGDSNIYLGYPGGIGLNEIDKFKDGGLTDNYGNMSTHEKLMRMAAEMYG